MPDITTIARPYAKAIFKLALDKKQLREWSTALNGLTQAILDEEAQQFILNPATTPELQTQLLLEIISAMTLPVQTEDVQHLIHLLAANKRLLVLPDIYIQYDALRAEQEKTLTASVSSFAPLTAAQQQHLVDSLSKRLQRQVTLEMSIDPSLLGGAVIRAGDLVIDGSVRGKLNKLATNMAA